MRKTIVAGCPADFSLVPIELAQPIHERKATKVNPLRKQFDELVATALLEGKVHKSKVLYQRHRNAKRTIRFAIGKQFVTESGQRFIRILMWVKLLVYDKMGELVERWHNFRLNYLLPSGTTAA